VPEGKEFKKHIISITYVIWQLLRSDGIPIFVILAKYLSIFVSVFRLLNRRYAKKLHAG